MVARRALGVERRLVEAVHARALTPNEGSVVRRVARVALHLSGPEAGQALVVACQHALLTAGHVPVLARAEPDRPFNLIHKLLQLASQAIADSALVVVRAVALHAGVVARRAHLPVVIFV